jgi:hypothetical protein
MHPRAASPDNSPRAVTVRTLLRLRQEDPDSFAGLGQSADGSLELLVTRSTAATTKAIDDARRLSGDQVPVRVVEGLRFSRAALEHLRDQILARHAELRSRGINITEFGVDEHANRVRVGIKGLTPQMADLVALEFGADMLNIVEGGEWV